MKVSESFVIGEGREAVWGVVGDVRRVAECMPGVEEVTIEDGDSGSVRITQKLGPMSATFDAKMQVTGREPGRWISFAATGRSIRGAVGNVRVTNSVRLEDEGDAATRVVLEAEVAVGGMLGSVGGKVIARQAKLAAKTFAANLEQAVRA
jgi:carbon monoxide dehydrogenase subunit G